MQKHLDAGEDVILEIEVQGALQVKEAAPYAELIFIKPPSMEELERRLRGRGSESEESIMRRMDAARMELSCEMEYDKTFVNDDIDAAVDELATYMSSTG